MSSSSGSSDGEDEWDREVREAEADIGAEVEEEVVARPVPLETTAERIRQAQADDAECGNAPCVLCTIGDHSVEGTAEVVKQIIDMERIHRRTSAPDIVYGIVVRHFNARIVRRMRERGKEIQPLTLAAARRHFSQNHSYSPERDLEYDFKYLGEMMRFLERTGNFKQTLPHLPKEPDHKNIDLYIKLLRERQNLWRMLHGTSASTTGVSGGGVTKKRGTEYSFQIHQVR